MGPQMIWTSEDEKGRKKGKHGGRKDFGEEGAVWAKVQRWQETISHKYLIFINGF